LVLIAIVYKVVDFFCWRCCETVETFGTYDVSMPAIFVVEKRLRRPNETKLQTMFSPCVS
jgi:hypothetical protein